MSNKVTHALDAEIEDLVNGNNELRKQRDELLAKVNDATPLTPEQAMAELEATLKRLGLVPFIVARSNMNGGTTPIDQFMPHTHTAMIQFQKAQ